MYNDRNFSLLVESSKQDMPCRAKKYLSFVLGIRHRISSPLPDIVLSHR